MKSLTICLLFIFSIFSAQFAELYSPCEDEIQLTSSVEKATDHEEHASNTKKHHCHKACAQCHSVIYVSAITTFNSDVYSDEIIFFSSVLSLNDFQLSVDRPPAFIV